MTPLQVNYRPFDDRTPDTQYRQLLERIIAEGKRVRCQQGVDALRLVAPNALRFDLSNGFPMITERSLKSFWQSPINELVAFIHGARTQAELEKYGCTWWKQWITPEKCTKRELQPGDMGPGSYGPAFHDFPTADGGSFNQFAEVIAEAKANPRLRTLFISPWVPQYIPRRKGRTQKVIVAPCHGWLHLFPDVDEGTFSLHMIQRSCDVPVGGPCNIIQYAALTIVLANVLNLRPKEYVHSFSDAHIYVDQVSDVMIMLNRTARPFPTVTLKKDVDESLDYLGSDFELEDYDPHPAIKGIPVAT